MREISETGVRTIATDLRGFLRLDGVGHWPQLAATGRINDALLGFLREVV